MAPDVRGRFANSLPEEWSALAATRFFLALIVAFSHLRDVYPLHGPTDVVASPFFEAVLAFLLISGYSIGRSYAKAPHGFYYRRLRRIYPIYLIALIATLLLDRSQGPPTPLVVAINLLLLNQLLTATSIIVPAWSLAVEAWLYGFTPLFAKLRTRWLFVLAAASLLAFLIYTMMRAGMHLPYYADTGFGIDLPLLAFAWLLGFLLARPGPKKWIAAAVIFAAFAHMGMQGSVDFVHRLRHHQPLALSFADVASLAWRLSVLLAASSVVIVAAYGGFGRRKSRLMIALGDASYPLYLINIAAFAAFFRLGVPAIAAFGLVCPIAYAVHLADHWTGAVWKQTFTARTAKAVSSA